MSTRKIGSVAKALLKGKSRIENIENWTQGVMHRGNRHCAIGAMQDLGTQDYLGACRFLRRAALDLFPQYAETVLVNDMFGHAAVMAMYDRAILDAISEGK
jgi:hypothetical protein